MDDVSQGIMISLMPIGVLFVIMIIYMIYKHSQTSKTNKNQSEANAIIEAQAALARIKKEQEAKENTEKKEENPKTETEKKEASKEEPKSKTVAKPTATAPIEDTSDLEPDIDKSTEE